MPGKDRTRKPTRQEAAGRVLGQFTEGDFGLTTGLGNLMINYS